MKTKLIAVLLSAVSLISLSGCRMKSEDGKPVGDVTSEIVSETKTTEKYTTELTKSTTTVMTTDPLLITDTIDSVVTVKDATFSVSSNWKKSIEKSIHYWKKSESHYLYVDMCDVTPDTDAYTYLQQLYNGYKSSYKIESYSTEEEINICGNIGIRFEVITAQDYDSFSKEAVVYATVYGDTSYLFVFVDENVEGYRISDFEAEVINSISFSGNDSAIVTDNESGIDNETETQSSITIGMTNALDRAKSYLDYTSFSYQGLIDQLLYEKYTLEEATYAVDNCGADWYEQAAKCAQSYIDYSSFSRQGLIEQLLYEGFTQEQAEYGVQSVGY